MHASLFTVAAAFAAVVSAQGTLPSCAQSCVVKYTTGSAIAGCSNLDIACICGQKSFLSDIACCLGGGCNAADLQATIDFAKSICLTAGVTVPSSVQGLCPSGGASHGTVAATAASPATSSASAQGTAGTTIDTSTATGTPTAAASGAATTTAAVAAGSSSASAAATPTRNVGVRNAIGEGVKVAGGLVAALVLL